MNLKIITILLIFGLIFFTGCTKINIEDIPINLPNNQTDNQLEENIDFNINFALQEFNLDENIFLHVIDIGQGDALLLEYAGKAILIDAGDNGKGTRVADYLKTIGINEVEYIVGTHIHADHVGGIDDFILEGINFKKYLGTEQECSTKSCADVDVLVAGKTILAEQGMILDFPIPILILNPTQPLEFENPNNNSIVLLVNAGKNDFLLTGDCEKECEEEIISSGILLESVNILKVGHHGSRTASSMNFLNAVTPEIGLISVGENNRYDHPHEESLERLQTKGVKIYRTDLQGNLIVTCDNKNCSVITEK